MNTPAPRPALKKAADAHIHPAAPGHSQHSLRPAPDSEATLIPEPREDAAAKVGTPDAPAEAVGAKGAHRLSGPLRGTTSDSLRAAAKGGRRRASGRDAQKTVELTVKVPKSLRRDFRAAVKAEKEDPDAVVAALLWAWLNG